MNRFIVDNCKNIYLAGYETTAVSAIWCLMLLASNQEWQDRVREDVLQVCKGQSPDANMLRKMKSVCRLPHLYMPFGVGPRACLGQNLAMVELKILLALLLSNFSFSLSPKYRHSPALRLVIEPGNGVHLLVRKLSTSALP
ncbi:hypothetical protein PVL29_007819 [Vitis rotundifolia]|uniref:Cytochrome P450 n=1 Tax=Vitis rotundifolia TaxID=103349 RepID=A0AA39DWR9_VITRO|nr:hypothetical protein PVL29_007819 [Vitis rotundifolia]